MLDYIVILCLHFLVTAILFSTGSIKNLHSHQQCTRIPIFPHSCQHLLCFSLFFSYNDVRWYLIIVLIWISLIISCSEHLFMCLLAMCIFFFWSNFYTSLLLFLKWICCCWVLGLLYMFWILIPYQICDLLIFSPIMWVDFYSVDSGFRFTFETFLSSPIVYFFFILCFWCYFQEIIAKSNVVKLLFYIFF